VRRLRSLGRYLWAAPTTFLGLLLLPAGIWRGHATAVDGVREVHGPLLAEVEARADFFTAIQEQLGLKVENTRTPVEVYVIDKVQKPSYD